MHHNGLKGDGGRLPAGSARPGQYYPSHGARDMRNAGGYEGGHHSNINSFHNTTSGSGATAVSAAGSEDVHRRLQHLESLLLAQQQQAAAAAAAAPSASAAPSSAAGSRYPSYTDSRGLSAAHPHSAPLPSAEGLDLAGRSPAALPASRRVHPQPYGSYPATNTAPSSYYNDSGAEEGLTTQRHHQRHHLQQQHLQQHQHSYQQQQAHQLVVQEHQRQLRVAQEALQNRDAEITDLRAQVEDLRRQLQAEARRQQDATAEQEQQSSLRAAEERQRGAAELRREVGRTERLESAWLRLQGLRGSFEWRRMNTDWWSEEHTRLLAAAAASPATTMSNPSKAAADASAFVKSEHVSLARSSRGGGGGGGGSAAVKRPREGTSHPAGVYMQVPTRTAMTAAFSSPSINLDEIVVEEAILPPQRYQAQPPPTPTASKRAGTSAAKSKVRTPRTPSQTGADKSKGARVRTLQAVSYDDPDFSPQPKMVPAQGAGLSSRHAGQHQQQQRPFDTPTKQGVEPMQPVSRSTTTMHLHHSGSYFVSPSTSPAPMNPARGPAHERCFLLSGLSEADRATVAAAVAELGAGASIVESGVDAEPPKRYTHVVIPGMPRSFKGLCGLVSGRWLLNTDYVANSRAAGFWLDETTANHMRCASPLPLAGRRFMIAPPPQAPMDADTRNRLRYIVEYGGGTVVDSSSSSAVSAACTIIQSADDILNFCMAAVDAE